MDLFSNALNENTNLLPHDGIVNYYESLMTRHRSVYYYETLMGTIPWRHDEAIIFGKHITTKRKVAWFGDQEYQYTYSNTTKTALIWTKELLELKALIEAKTGSIFNSCLLNLYHDGSEGMAWHSDDEKSLGKNTAIASLSFGATRKFCFRHKLTRETISMVLESGSLLMMKDSTQTHWLHRLPPTKRIKTPRINLTFRTINY
ncbi:MAG: alpha-ketoglutarate-dependent dioxygenase AlkB family protein [Sphingobacteriaceae bacterium]